jgi:hypothetical protein
MWRRTWSSPSTTRTNCTSAEQRTQMARRTPASSSEDPPAVGPSGGRESLPDITQPEADTPRTGSRLTARLNHLGVFGGGVRATATGAGRSRERGLQETRLSRGPARRHILRLMPERQPNAPWPKLGAEPGLCGACRHAKLNETRRGTSYLRCTRAAWDVTLSRYPRLPVTQCGGFERREGNP